jgi:predicted transcriptional regulator
MPNLSVKLDEATRLRLHDAAASQDMTPHAFMVKAIDAELERTEAQNRFVARALRVREEVINSGRVVDGAAFADYQTARVRGVVLPRPEVQFLKTEDSGA